MKANILKSEMALKNITQEELAKRLNISRTELSNKITGKHNFSFDQAREVGNILGLDRNKLAEIFLD